LQKESITVRNLTARPKRYALDETKIKRDRPSITTGTVIEVYDVPFPRFQTNARFDGGMSGGPVFNENGELCGIISSGFVFSEDGGSEATFVSSLWPLMGLQLDIPIQGNESIDTYLLADLANAEYIRTLNLNRVAIERNEDGSVNRVGFRK
jgi:trypsin-like peptidase